MKPTRYTVGDELILQCYFFFAIASDCLSKTTMFAVTVV